MKNNQFKTFVLSIGIYLCIVYGCEEHSYIEDLGYSFVSEDDDDIGYAMFYSTNVEVECKELKVYVDSVYVGFINKNYDNSIHGSITGQSKSIKNTVIKSLVRTGRRLITVESGGGCTFSPIYQDVAKNGGFYLNIYSK